MKKLLSILAFAALSVNIAVAQQETAKEKPACCANKEACAKAKADGKSCSGTASKDCKKKCDKNCKKSCCAKASSSADAAAPAKSGCSGHSHEGHGHDHAAPAKK